MEDTKLQDWNGYEVYLKEDGTFYTVQDGNRVEATSLAGLKKKLAAIPVVVTPVDVMLLGRSGASKGQVLGFGKMSKPQYVWTARKREFETTPYWSHIAPYLLYDKAISEEYDVTVNAYNKKIEALEVEKERDLDAIRVRAVVLTESDVMRLLAGEPLEVVKGD